ncbi:MAG: flavin reductase [Pseudomonadota bacterium]
MSDLENAASQTDLHALRQAFGCFVTGVTVVTTKNQEGSPRGFTANSFTSVSLDPPLILVCIGKNAGSYPVFQTCDFFAVNILAESQKETSGIFASKVEDRFAKVDWFCQASGAPLLKGALSWLECRTEERIESGDHLILIGRVINFQSGNDRPLGYFRGSYVNFGLAQKALSDAQGHRLVLGCIAQQEGQVLLCRASSSDKWTVPSSSFGSSKLSAKAALEELFQNMGSPVELSFLYSVFELPEDGTQHVIYRGNFEGPLKEINRNGLETRLFGSDQIPWSEMASQQIANMLRRYLHERSSARFGIYVDNKDGGHVATLEEPPQPWRQLPINPPSSGTV